MGRCHNVVSGQSVVNIFRKLSSALNDIVENDEIVLHQNIVSNEQTVTYGEFVIDSTANVNVSFAIFVANAEDHFIKSVSFTDLDTGVIYGPFNAISSLYDNINMKTVNYGLQTSSLLSSGRWKYRLEWVKSRHRQVSAVVVFAKSASIVDNYQISTWTSSQNIAEIVTIHHPLSIHVEVTRDNRPVLRANVSALVSVTRGDTVTVLSPVQLHDNGNGDSDLVAHDGVYSRYLVNYPHPGVYSVDIIVNDDSNTAVVAGRDDYPDNTKCCGSTTNINLEGATRTGAFGRVVAGSVTINIVETPDRSKLAKVPPSRIGDLQVKRLSRSDKIQLIFTAPGEDFDEGSVDEYIVVFDRKKESILRNWSNHQILTRFKNFNVSGERVEKYLVLKQSLNSLYVGVVGVDKEKNYGAVSNIVHVMMSSSSGGVIYSQTDNKDDTLMVVRDAATAAERVNEEWMLILALCSSFFLLSLCLFGGVFYFLKCAKPKKPVMVDIGVSDDVTDPDNVSHCSSEIRNMTCEFPLMLDVTGLLGRDSRSQTPTHWSASQLLAEHEARSRPGTLTPITEEYLGHFTEYGNNNDYHEISDPGLTNLAYTSTPMRHPLYTPSNIAVMDSCTDTGSDSVESGGALPDPEMFSLGVQTVAPSCVASIRQSSDMVMVAHQRQSSLV